MADVDYDSKHPRTPDLSDALNVSRDKATTRNVIGMWESGLPRSPRSPSPRDPEPDRFSPEGSNRIRKISDKRSQRSTKRRT